MKLTPYHKKRKFDHTLEPKGKAGKSGKSRIFIVQKHDSRHLHYDFRLEIDGVLKSWAIPKGPSLDPNIKRLAVQVEDHPLEYGNFEGIIPKGHYGSGTVMLWDKGTWHEIKEDKKNNKNNIFSFELKGKKLKGVWKLIRIKNDPKNWLLIKGKDNKAISQEKYDILDKQSLSVASDKSMDEIAEDSKGRPNPKDLNIKKSKLPAKIKPQLATLVDKAPIGNDWLHEMKFDGYRLISIIKDKATLNILTRNGLDWTKNFKKIADEIKKIKLSNTILDGEVVVLDEQGKPSFQLLQNAMKGKIKAAIVYYVFDIIYYEGRNLSTLSLIDRKKILEQIIPKNNDILRYSDHVIGHGQSMFENACELGLEGIMSKNCKAGYTQKRTQSWLKIKCHHRQEFIVGGYTKPKDKRAYFGSLLLGYYEKNKFKYCGRVGTGFNANSLKEIYSLLEKNKVKECPFATKPPMQDFASWVKPKIVVEVEFTELTLEGILRHPSFKGLREDKKATCISREKAHPINGSSKNHPSFDFEITHSDRVVYPKTDITKLEVAKYYYDIHEWILPFIISRPLAIVRCPTGINGPCFFQKHILNDNKNQQLFQGENHLYIKNIKGLMQLIQIGTLEIHPYGNRVDKPNRPDMITFDLDPGEGIKWKKIVDTAFMIREELEKYDLVSFVKTTGGKGLHVVVPIIRRYDWEYVSLFAKTFSQYIVNKYPTDYANVMSKFKRKQKIYIDYLRNKPGASAIAPYSTRAKDLATVATPLSWDELSVKTKSSNFTIRTVKKRLDKLTVNPWRDFFALKQKLPK